MRNGFLIKCLTKELSNFRNLPPLTSRCLQMFSISSNLVHFCRTEGGSLLPVEEANFHEKVKQEAFRNSIEALTKPRTSGWRLQLSRFHGLIPSSAFLSQSFSKSIYQSLNSDWGSPCVPIQLVSHKLKTYCTPGSTTMKIFSLFHVKVNIDFVSHRRINWRKLWGGDCCEPLRKVWLHLESISTPSRHSRILENRLKITLKQLETASESLKVMTAMLSLIALSVLWSRTKESFTQKVLLCFRRSYQRRCWGNNSSVLRSPAALKSQPSHY